MIVRPESFWFLFFFVIITIGADDECGGHIRKNDYKILFESIITTTKIVIPEALPFSCTYSPMTLILLFYTSKCTIFYYRILVEMSKKNSRTSGKNYRKNIPTIK